MPPMPLRGELVFVDQSAEQVAAADTIEAADIGRWLLATQPPCTCRRQLRECAVRPMLVVVPRVRREDVVEVAATDDEQPVEALAAGGPDPALGVSSSLRCADRRFDDADAFGAEDLVELAGELAVMMNKT